MDTFLKITGGLVVAAGAFFLLPMVGVVFGAFSGWVVGLFWSGTILGFLQHFGVNTDGLAVWQIGASLGFLGSFFRPTVTAKS